MKYLLLMVLVLGSMACTGATEERVLELQYFKDSRTGLCFAERYWGSQTGVVTNVPCTTEVERMLRK